MTDKRLAPLSISLLGNFHISIGGEEINTGRFRLRKSRHLVKLLALAPGHRLHREQLMELLWPDFDPESAANNLHQALYAARRALGALDDLPEGYLLYEDENLSFNPAASVWVDVDAFEQAAAEARRGREPHLYHNALELYTGDLLPEDLYEEWMLTRRESLRLEHLGLLRELGGIYESRGEYQAGIEILQKLVHADPSNEEAHVELMRLLALDGRRSTALAQYKACRKALQEGLGVEPGVETIRLYEAIRDGRLEGIRETEEAPPTDQFLQTVPIASPPRTNNLPAPSTRLVGRQAELERLCELLDNPDCRLVTVLGAGGSGKSRLALEAGHTLLPLFSDGVFWVGMDTFQADRSLAPLVCAALHLKVNPTSDTLGEVSRVDLQNELVAYLGQKKLLLILDGFEGMLHEANLVADLLRRAPQLKILVSSRARLNIQSEHIFPLGGLDYPPALDESGDNRQYSALQLFEQAARRSLGSFELETRKIFRWKMIPYKLLTALMGVKWEAFVAEKDGKVVGGGMYIGRNNRMTLTNLMVDPEYRRQGIGQALLTKRLERLSERGFPYVTAQVLDTNTASLENLKKQDFEVFNQYSVYERILPVSEIKDSAVPSAAVREIKPSDRTLFQEIEKKTTPSEVLSLNGSAESQYFPSRWQKLYARFTGYSKWIKAFDVQGEIIGFLSADFQIKQRKGFLLQPMILDEQLLYLPGIIQKVGAWLEESGRASMIVDIPDQRTQLRDCLLETGWNKQYTWLELIRWLDEQARQNIKDL